MNIRGSAIDRAVAYLAAMQDRDLDLARRYVADTGLTLVFPGGRRFSRLEDIRSNSAGRYEIVKKHILDCHAWEHEGAERVMITGTLYGKWLDGRSFDGIRFIDWFEMRDGLIVRQEVWNDTGERLLEMKKGTSE
ncbi:nuclear transport factor 2 family protein [Psychromarinibacter halotolerans]|uniref:Nuclear transport factor 2 family protein n=1 Tax=Psychromarinibacter halotolerans TaxID=1775175 RepID=A0ABV7GYU2_9RHOB|nr:nuclear transport factor 2 family protein [Psychromarinibacter halotolerans]MDF0596244.1 nuclear transport factor 2 family protein [Psychromarinibacter halotolerans]